MKSQEFRDSRPVIEESTDRVQTNLEQYRLPVASEESRTPLPVVGASHDVSALGFPNLNLEDAKIAQARIFNRGIQPVKSAGGCVMWDSPDGRCRTVIRPDGSAFRMHSTESGVMLESAPDLMLW
ncbi:MAG: hypothetical protein SFV17_03850 [Candidatus Obscuribacter sp.]|nr:hypothetical protein [Candidatus Obscuribacter sp.]